MYGTIKATKRQGDLSMLSKEPRLFDVDGKKMQFNFQAFIDAFQKFKVAKKMKVSELENMIAQKVNVSPEAVHNWRFKSNGPSDLNTIKEIAAALGFSNRLFLLKEIREDTGTMKLTDLQKESAKRIYDSIIEYLNDFSVTDGFTGTLWIEFSEQGYKNPEDAIYDYANKKISEVHLVIQKEYFYLHDSPIYDELIEYSYNDLYDIYEGKLGYAYRFEALVDGNPTTEDDYEKALAALNNIVDKYS